MVHRHHYHLHLEHHHRRHQVLITEFWVWHHPHRRRQAKSELHLGDGCGLHDLEGRNTEVRETKGQLSMALTLAAPVASMVLIMAAQVAPVASTVLIMAALEGLAVPMAGHHTPNGK